jgi:ABC-type phosphate transport system substrate-binding protein
MIFFRRVLRMKNAQKVLWGVLILFCLVSPAISDVLVIANNTVTEESLTVKKVQLIFLGKIKKWPDGKKIHIAALKKGNLHETFLTDYVNKSPDKFSSFWKIATVSGTGYPPKYFESETDLLEYVSGKDGAIGYISSETPHDGVKVIPVQ